MPQDTKTPQQPPSTPAFGDKLATAGTVQKQRTPQRVSQVTEPTMRALRRILGDGVLDVFPDGIIKNTDALYELHKADPAAWAEITMDSPAERDDLLKLMRAYAECAGETGYTIRQDRLAEPHMLRIRVVPRKGSGKADGEETTD